MLILSRKVNETIVIDEDIKVTVLSVKGANVRIGCEAPKHIRVDREEIHERKLAALENNDTAELEVS